MATHLDQQEQEQLEALKAFWKQYGNLITWLLIVLLGAYAAWNGWNYWQREQALKAGAMYDELDRRAQAGDADGATRVFGDLKDRYGSTVQAAQGGLLAARVQFESGQADAARASLAWVAENAPDDELKTVARLRLAGLLIDARKPEEALQLLDGATAPAFAALVADRRGDALMALNKPIDARATYEVAWKAMDANVDYRRLLEAKLTALGAAPAAASGAVP